MGPCCSAPPSDKTPTAITTEPVSQAPPPPPPPPVQQQQQQDEVKHEPFVDQQNHEQQQPQGDANADIVEAEEEMVEHNSDTPKTIAPFDEEYITKMFWQHDYDNSGFLEAEEATIAMMVLLGPSASVAELADELRHRADLDGDGRISLDEFLIIAKSVHEGGFRFEEALDDDDDDDENGGHVAGGVAAAASEVQNE